MAVVKLGVLNVHEYAIERGLKSATSRGCNVCIA